MKRLSKAFLVFSSFLYTAFLFYVYAYFAEQSMVYINVFDDTVSFSNNILFYVGLIVPLIAIILFVLLANIVDKQPIGQNYFIKNQASKIQLSSWSLSLGGAINLFAGSLLSVILFSNNEEGVTTSGYLPILITCLIIVAVWIIWLPIILLKNK